MIKITIPLPPITKKNHSQIFRTKDGRPFITTSKQYKDYVRDCIFIFNEGKVDKPIDYPVNVKAYYFMPTKRKVDLTNLHACLHDVLVHYGILADDNCNIIVSTDGSRVFVDKENPRTEVYITEAK